MNRLRLSRWIRISKSWSYYDNNAIQKQLQSIRPRSDLFRRPIKIQPLLSNNTPYITRFATLCSSYPSLQHINNHQPSSSNDTHSQHRVYDSSIIGRCRSRCRVSSTTWYGPGAGCTWGRGHGGRGRAHLATLKPRLALFSLAVYFSQVNDNQWEKGKVTKTLKWCIRQEHQLRL